MEPLRSIISLILDSKLPAHSLRQEVVELMKILADSGTFRAAHDEDIWARETRTPNGLALSPSMAALCAGDFARTIAFLRGTQAAILDIRKRYPDRPARVLYAGCGPYAILAVPLMAIFSPQEAVFTLLDIHPESIESARRIVDTLGLTGSVACYETIDVCSYQIDPGCMPDLILMEMMQSCLASEPQVAAARHLLPQAPHAILIPAEVRVELALVDPSREFVLDAGDLQRDRIPLGPVFILNRASVNAWQGMCGNCLPGLSARLPDCIEPRYQPMLFTSIRVYREHVLKDYDSGLTCPRRFSSDAPVQAGDTIYFHYELGQRPRLKGAPESNDIIQIMFV